MNRWLSLLVLTIFALWPTAHLQAQNDIHPLIPTNLAPITPTNATHIQQVNQLGRGRIFWLDWMDNHLGVATSMGAWVYDSEDLTESNWPTEPIIPALSNQADAGTFSSDGRFFASGSLSGEIALYNVTTHQQFATLKGHTDSIIDVIFSPNGSLLASDSKDGTVRVWGMATLSELTLFRKGETLDSPIVFSPDGLSLIWATSESPDAAVGGYTIHAWNSKTSVESVLVKRETPQTGTYLSSIAISPEGRYLAVGANFELHLWDTKTGMLVWAKDDHELGLINYSITISPKWVVAATTDLGGFDESVRVFDRVSGELIQNLDDFVGVVNQVRINSDGTRLAVCGYDGALRLFDTTTFTELGRVTGHYSTADHIALSVNGDRLAAGGFDSLVRVWDMATSEELPTLEPDWFASVEGVAWSPDGTRLLAIANHAASDYKVWDTTTAAEIPTEVQYSDRVFSGVFSADGDSVWLAMMQNAALTVLQVSLAGGNTITHPLVSLPPTAARFNADGRQLVTGDEVGTIHIWDTNLGKPTAVFLQNGAVRSLAYNADETLLASASADGQIWVWEIATGKLLAQFELGEVEVSSLAFSPNNQLLAAGGNNGALRVLDIASQAELVALQGHLHTVTSVAFTADGMALISGSYDSTVRVWGVRP